MNNISANRDLKPARSAPWAAVIDQGSLPTALHVEDDLNDALLLELSFHRAHLPVLLQHVGDGQEAVNYSAMERSSAQFETISTRPVETPVTSIIRLLESIRRVHDEPRAHRLSSESGRLFSGCQRTFERTDGSCFLPWKETG